ncbi:predicted protein [Naegleria gruberi]|uniref:Predicted protein n=1 Tax=Naegleria gruberi TaxID=5762 RepID=D2W170_NAEGR|nr:uncharacterized protein NAEGRDRAFT_75110 [Naegleria gruberi]EFC37178.1 predicted protein [Naegleria gruberi]|eukprot:XP_002669922.1 predicted protein [Naegleria gruberi strain NEG-M]
MEESLKRKLSESVQSSESEDTNNHHKKLKTNGNQSVQNIDESECPYLDTINRKVLDFDFEKVCSETLSNTNVYCCLVDGKFFKGKGESTPAYIHSLNEDHHLFMSISNGKIYCLPDNYEVNDKSLEDIKFNLNPTYSEKDVEELDIQLKTVTSISNGATFMPGFVGLNSIKQSTDGINVAIQALTRIKPVRDFFLLDQKNLSKVKSRSVLLFSELLRKIWNPKNFKNHVNPLEFVQSILSNAKQFKLGESIDPVQFFTWLLNYLHGELTDNQPKQKSIISESFRGRITITSKVIKRKKSGGADKKQVEETTSQNTTPFMFLTLDVPSAPIFKDEYERNILPQVSLFSLLSKFNGEKETAVPLNDGNVEMRKYKIEKLPPYLVFHVKRFSKNFFFEEKNNTIVNFPLNNLDISEIAPDYSGSHYNLVANICHDGSVYKIHVHNVAEGKWYEIQDLDVKEVIAEEVSISQSFLLVYAKQ